VTTLTATEPISAVTGSTTLTVTPAILTSITVTPADLSVPVGATRQFTATGTYSDSTNQDLTGSVTWSSTSGSVATVSNAPGSEGLATGVFTGSTSITSTDVGSGVSGFATLDVIQDIAFRSAASAGSAAGLSLMVPKPAGTLSGDVLIASIAVRPNTAAITPPSGWTLVRRVDNATGNSSSLAVYWRVAVVGEPVGHTWVLSTSTGSVGSIAAFYGADPSSAIDVEDGQSTPSSLTHDTPSVTTTRTGTMLVTAHAFSTSASWTPPGGMTEALEVASLSVPNSAGVSLGLNYALQPAAGASGVKSASADAGADTGNTQVLALSPGP